MTLGALVVESLITRDGLMATRMAPAAFSRDHRQAVLLKAFGQHFQYSPGVFFTGESHGEVVRKANQKGAPFQAWLNILLEPVVQHVVQEYIREHRADYAPNNVAKQSLIPETV